MVPNSDSTPYFSIVIPIHNRAEFIAATLQSVPAQTFSALEIIVGDDGSKDNTAEVVRQFTDARLHYYPKQNEEWGKARNYGLARAKGEYVIFLDSDDLFHLTHLATLRQAIEEQQEPNLIATKYNFDRNGHLVPSDLAALPAGTYGFNFFAHGNALACDICVRRTNPNLHLFEEDRRYAAVEDWMFMLENTQQDTVCLVDAGTLTMNDQRSIRADNSGLVRRLTAAGDWMKQHLRMSATQIQQFLGHVHYLYAIHNYMDGHWSAALSHWRQSGGSVNWLRRLPLLVRIVARATLMNNLKGLAS